MHRWGTGNRCRLVRAATSSSQRAQAHLALLLRPRLADPPHRALHHGKGAFLEDKFYHLSRFHPESPSHPKTIRRRIEDDAGNSLYLHRASDDQTGALSLGCTLQPSTFTNGESRDHQSGKEAHRMPNQGKRCRGCGMPQKRVNQYLAARTFTA